MNKKNTKQIPDSFDDDYFSDLEYVVPDNKNLVYDPDIIKNLGLYFNSNFELVPKSLDSEKTIVLPKDNVDREILDFEYYRTTTACFYVIYNIIHNKYYVGQTSNLIRRIFDHIRDLDRGTHDNSALQTDFDNIKSRELKPYKYFKVYTIQNTSLMRSYSTEESYVLDLELRQIEALLIKTYRDAGYNLYNSTGFTKGQSKRLKKKEEPEEFWSVSREVEERGLINCSLSYSSRPVPVMIKGIEYKSLNNAAAVLNQNRRHVFHCILSKRFPDYMTKEQAETGNLYVYFKKERRIKFTNTITGEEIIFSNASQCNTYLTDLKRKSDAKTFAKYKDAGIFVEKKTIYSKLDKGESLIFSHYSQEDAPEKVLVKFD